MQTFMRIKQGVTYAGKIKLTRPPNINILMSFLETNSSLESTLTSTFKLVG